VPLLPPTSIKSPTLNGRVVRRTTALARFESESWMESETARPATLKIASSDDVSTPSVPASSMTARNTSTILIDETMKVWKLLSSLDDLSIFSVARRMIFMHKIHITSKIAAETSFGREK